MNIWLKQIILIDILLDIRCKWMLAMHALIKMNLLKFKYKMNLM